MTNQAALIQARLFEKAIRDALSGLAADVSVSKGVDTFGHCMVRVDVSKVIGGRKLLATTLVTAAQVESMDSVYSFGKSIGFRLATTFLEEVCESQPQELTISLKDIDKARQGDRKSRMVVPYGGRPHVIDPYAF